ncbi:MAG: hypothetical protein A2Y17_08825 [Clostridiales bacterium GWF2_38_85]|nr:MAG: hypothetical protein A2Y17_08825 [Clostridiales bacterium GWF2_38_85]HBL83701.1 hypothetical protein [Clostridiales bacterium]
MALKEEEKLKADRTAVNRTIKNIEDILDQAHKTTVNALGVTRNTESIDIIDKNTNTQENDIPSIVFFANSNNDNDLAKSFAKKIKQDKNLSDYLTGNVKKVPDNRMDELYKFVKADTTETKIPTRLSTEEPILENSGEFEQTVLFKHENEDELISDEQIINELTKGEQPDKTVDFDDDYANLTDKILKSDFSLFKGEQDTKQIQLSLGDTGEIDKIPKETTLDATDINLRLAFNMLDSDVDIPDDMKNLPDQEIFDKASGNKKRKNKKAEATVQRDDNLEIDVEDELDYEYTSHEQDGEVESILKKAIKSWRIKLALVFVFAIGILFIETATKTSTIHPIFLRQGRYGLLYTLVDLQLLFFITITMLGSIIKGIKDLFKLTPTIDSLLFVSILLPAINTVFVAFSNPTASSLTLYNLAGAATAFFVVIAKLMQSKRDFGCFEILSDDRPKYAAESIKGGTREADEFYKYLLEDSEIYTVKRTDFVGGFFKRITTRARSEDIILWQLLIVIVSAVLIFAIGFMKGENVLNSYKYASALIATAFPISAVFISILPTYKSNKLARRSESALIGNAFTEEYDSAAVISFADTEVFPASNVKLTSLKTYGDFRIDMVIQDTARIFSKIGGPLSIVLNKALSEEAPALMNFKLIDCASDGLLVSAEGKDIYIGKRAFMRNFRFIAPVEDGDNDFEAGNGSIMYVAIDDELAAKLYIKYQINPRFDSLLKDMYRAGMCVGIKTFDPNISNELLVKTVRFTKCPIAILKADKPDDITGKSEVISSAIATNGSLHTFLKMFILCDKTRHSIKSNLVLSICSLILSIAIVTFLALTGSVSYLNSVYALMFQLLWLTPIGAMSYLS